MYENIFFQSDSYHGSPAHPRHIHVTSTSHPRHPESLLPSPQQTLTELAAAIHQALTLDPALRELRQDKLHRYVSTHTSTFWARSFVGDMSRCADEARVNLRRRARARRVPLRKMMHSYVKGGKRRTKQKRPDRICLKPEITCSVLNI